MLDSLKKTLRADQISEENETIRKYGRDWTTAFEVKAAAVVFPESTEDVAKIVRWARKEKVALVPSGGRTGLSGGAVASQNEVVVSLDRMNKILHLDPVEQIVRCEAGVITEVLQKHAVQEGFYFPVDFASRGSSHIGGNIATNAGGIRVIRYGLMRDWVLSLQVVTGEGQVLQLNRDLIKDNSGYDLRQLFIGSEGTLGFITAATLRLTKPPAESALLLLASDQLSHALEILKTFRNKITLTAFEFFTESALQKVLSAHDLQRPFASQSPFYFLLEFEKDSEAQMDLALEAFDLATQTNLVQDGVVSQNDKQREDFWKYREFISESLAPFTPYKADISVKISRIPSFVSEAEKELKQRFGNLEIVWFGHIGDGNLHINVLKSSQMSKEEFKAQTVQISQSLFAIIQKFEGSISAEHGIGLVKKPYLAFSKSLFEIDMMKKVKKVFDPDGILNPGKIFDI